MEFEHDYYAILGVSPDADLEESFEIAAPLEDFGSTPSVSFDIVFDGDKPARIKDAFRISLKDLEDTQELALKLNLKLQAGKK